MSRSKRLAQQRARQIVAAQRRAEARRRRLTIAIAAVAAVLAVAGVLVGVKFASGGGRASAAASSGPASDAVLSEVTGVPPAVLDQIGAGKVTTPPSTISGQAPLTDGGKPLVVYAGAEYCPYCAAERWAMVVALSRFGTFSNLGQTHSSSTDIYPDTATLSFHGSTYTSAHLAFQGIEEQSNEPSGSGYAQLDTPTAQQQQLIAKYDAAPYVQSDAAGSIPFVDFGNRAVISGASFSPQLLAGMSADQIAAALSDPSSPVAQAIDGAANAITNVLCQLTGGQPGSVCTSAAASAYQGKLHAAG